MGTVSTMLEKERLVRTAICVPIDADDVTACSCKRREGEGKGERENVCVCVREILREERGVRGKGVKREKGGGRREEG